MKKLFNFLTVLTLALSLSFPTYAGERENRPNPNLTPGDIITTDKKLICMKGFSKMIRRTTYEMKRLTYKAYEIRNTRANKIDHLVPLSLGGADTMKNLWPSDFNAKHHTADDKDRLELKIRKLVCNGKMSVSKGQKLFIKDWHAAYDTYCPNRKACPSYKEIQDQKKTFPKKKTFIKHPEIKVTSNGIKFFDGVIIVNFDKLLDNIMKFFKEAVVE